MLVVAIVSCIWQNKTSQLFVIYVFVISAQLSDACQRYLCLKWKLKRSEKQNRREFASSARSLNSDNLTIVSENIWRFYSLSHVEITIS